jgi:asparagine synthetase B (glutamine-hydrolysing)
MLRFDIRHVDVAGQWQWDWHAQCWRSESSWVDPVRSPALQVEPSLAGGGTKLIVRETRPDGDFTELALGPDGTVRLVAGPLGIAPLYVAASDERLIGSWDPADLAPFADPGGLSPVVVARLLTRRHRYSAETLFARITRLTAGASIEWSRRGGLRLRYPEPASHVSQPRRLRSGVDPVAHFGKLMDHNVSGDYLGTIAVELSGGLDSANVAVSVAHMCHRRALSGGLVMAGRTGHDQDIRRQTIIGRLGLRDVALTAADHLPLAPDGPRTVEHVHYPDTDVYLEAFDALRARLRETGAHVVYTGFGGDEIMSRTPAERLQAPTLPRLPPWLDDRTRDALLHVDSHCSPITHVALPTLVVFAARHPAYLRAGLWPIAPFTAPQLSRFARSLPVEWRVRKELLRQRLARVGLPTTVTHPRRPESFAATMSLALRRHAPALLTDMLERSVLIAHGFIRRATVERLCRRAGDGGTMPPLVYDMLALAIGIRSMCTASAGGGRKSCASSTPNR